MSPSNPASLGQHSSEPVVVSAGKEAHPTLLSRLKRYALWWLAFFGIYAASSVCPLCGTPGCPVGAGGAAAVGGFFTLLWQYGRNIFGGSVRLVKHWLGRT